MHDSESGVSDTGMEVAEAQWKAYVQKLREGGELSSAMAICDVSGSMHGQPMEARTLTANPYPSQWSCQEEHTTIHLYKYRCTASSLLAATAWNNYNRINNTCLC